MTTASDQRQSYPAFLRSMHWLLFFIVLGSLTTGFVGYWGAVTQPWEKESFQAPPASAGPPPAALPGSAAAPTARQRDVAMQQRRGASPWSANQLHKSLGVIVLALMLVRLIYRLSRPMPDTLPDVPPAMRWSARASHTLLYIGLILQPILGLTGSGRAFRFLNVVTIPSFTVFHPYIRQLHTAHVDVAYLLVVLIVVHACAALYHHLVRRDRVLVNMLALS